MKKDPIISLAEVGPSEDTVMTALLGRLFAEDGCSPPLCHACGCEITRGQVFKLVPHQRKREDRRSFDSDKWNDEMCCAKCDGAALTRRDKREKLAAKRWNKHIAAGGGYSRPSRTQERKEK